MAVLEALRGDMDDERQDTLRGGNIIRSTTINNLEVVSQSCGTVRATCPSLFYPMEDIADDRPPRYLISSRLALNPMVKKSIHRPIFFLQRDPSFDKVV